MGNQKNLQQQEAIAKLKELAKDIDICLFCTNVGNHDGSTTRPMSTQEVDEDGNIWFISGKNTVKTHDIEEDSRVQLFYSHPSKSSYLVVNGEAEVLEDRQKIEELWGPLLKTWFKGGKDDPNITLIKVNTQNAYYWDVEGNQMINFFKMLASVATGKTLVDAEEGRIKV